jgi:hypothetical protein
MKCMDSPTYEEARFLDAICKYICLLSQKELNFSKVAQMQDLPNRDSR